MAHRIRHTMSQEPLSVMLRGRLKLTKRMSGEGDSHPQSTAVKPGQRMQDRIAPFDGKQAVVSVLQRGGRVQSRHVQRVTVRTFGLLWMRWLPKMLT